MNICIQHNAAFPPVSFPPEECICISATVICSYACHLYTQRHRHRERCIVYFTASVCVSLCELKHVCIPRIYYILIGVCFKGPIEHSTQKREKNTRAHTKISLETRAHSFLFNFSRHTHLIQLGHIHQISIGRGAESEQPFPFHLHNGQEEIPVLLSDACR